jgi:hypothetical protein
MNKIIWAGRSDVTHPNRRPICFWEYAREFLIDAPILTDMIKQ